MWHWDSSNNSIHTNCSARNTFLAQIKCVEVLLMPKPRWPPISSDKNVKTPDENSGNATKVFSYLHPNYGIMHQVTTKPHYKPLCKIITIYKTNKQTFHLIALRHIAVNKDISKFWKQTISGDASFCYVIMTLFYITLTLQITLINATYLDILVSNIPITPWYESFCVRP